MELFDVEPQPRLRALPDEVAATAARLPGVEATTGSFQTGVDARFLEVFEHATDPGDPLELRDLWLGRVECEVGGDRGRAPLASRWRETSQLREVDTEEVLSSKATVGFVKELFNAFFRDDLYGDLRDDDHLILSSGAVAETAWGLPEALKACLEFALRRDWYGYSDSRGREPARSAIAAYESERTHGRAYEASNVVLTMGGTSAVSSLADFICSSNDSPAPALCGIPNYPPLVQAVARRHPVELVPLPVVDQATQLDALIDALEPQTPLVLIQTAANPTGAAVREADLELLIRAASPSTMIILDECHEWLGPLEPCSAARSAANIVRVSSLSKMWSGPGLKVGWFLADPALVADYYEYASTTFGGPPSLFYTLIEVLARMERWLLCGIDALRAEHLAEFEDSYGLRLDRLQQAFAGYRTERVERDLSLRLLRDAATVLATDAGASVIAPVYSINTTLQLDDWTDSYVAFRELLRDTRVAVFPSVLTFCLSGSALRVTTALEWTTLTAAFDRLRDRRS